MKTVLHILTRKADELAERVIAQEEQESGLVIRRFDLTAREPDYNQLLEQIFEVDSVQVW